MTSKVSTDSSTTKYIAIKEFEEDIVFGPNTLDELGILISEGNGYNPTDFLFYPVTTYHRISKTSIVLSQGKNV